MSFQPLAGMPPGIRHADPFRAQTHHQPRRVHLRLTESGKNESDLDRARGMLLRKQAREPPAFQVSSLVRPSLKDFPKSIESSGARHNNESPLCWFLRTSTEVVYG